MKRTPHAPNAWKGAALLGLLATTATLTAGGQALAPAPADAEQTQGCFDAVSHEWMPECPNVGGGGGSDWQPETDGSELWGYPDPPAGANQTDGNAPSDAAPSHDSTPWDAAGPFIPAADEDPMNPKPSTHEYPWPRWLVPDGTPNVRQLRRQYEKCMWVEDQLDQIRDELRTKGHSTYGVLWSTERWQKRFRQIWENNLCRDMYDGVNG